MTTTPYTVTFVDFQGGEHSYSLLADDVNHAIDQTYDQKRDALRVLTVRPEQYPGL